MRSSVSRLTKLGSLRRSCAERSHRRRLAGWSDAPPPRTTATRCRGWADSGTASGDVPDRLCEDPTNDQPPAAQRDRRRPAARNRPPPQSRRVRGRARCVRRGGGRRAGVGREKPERPPAGARRARFRPLSWPLPRDHGDPDVLRGTAGRATPAAARSAAVGGLLRLAPVRQPAGAAGAAAELRPRAPRGGRAEDPRSLRRRGLRADARSGTGGRRVPRQSRPRRHRGGWAGGAASRRGCS